MGFCLGLSYENGIFDSHQKYHCSFKCNMFIRDLRIKHLNAFICQWLKINESDIHGYFFDGEVYYETDDEDIVDIVDDNVKDNIESPVVIMHDEVDIPDDYDEEMNDTDEGADVE